ncbi:MAG: response regulator [Verrucomicrobiae bacterium]|nr:response regulator [Verrucomicrobiae bacterium]
MSIRALIVDDEPLARERIRTLLREEPDVEVVGECADGPAAVAAIQKLSPDLLFLDVQMPGMDGFGVLRALGHAQMPEVIFVTAHDQHAVKAFEAHALDYLLKPFKPARFREAVRRAREQLARRRAGAISENLAALLAQQPAPRARLSRIAVKSGERTVFVKTSEIEYIESAGNYLVLHAGRENHVIRETLGALEAQLDPKQFVRINRSTLVNVEQIRELQPLFKGEHVVVLRNGRQLPLTRGVRELQELLKFS